MMITSIRQSMASQTSNAEQLRRQAKAPPSDVPLISAKMFQGLNLRTLETVALAQARSKINNPSIQRVEFCQSDSKLLVQFSFHDEPKQEQYCRVDLDAAGNMRGEPHVSGDLVPNPKHKTVPSLAGLRISLTQAADKVFSEPELKDTRFSRASIAINDDGQLVFHFFHSADWAREANVEVDGRTGKMTIERFDPVDLELKVVKTVP